LNQIANLISEQKIELTNLMFFFLFSFNDHNRDSYIGIKEMLKNGITNTFTISCKRELRLNVELKLGKIEELFISEVICEIQNFF